MKITVVGLGYVGLSNAITLAQKNEVIGLDTATEKVTKVNDLSFLKKESTKALLGNDQLNLTATTDRVQAYSSADIVVIATPTDYNPKTNCFNTSSIEIVISDVLAVNSKADIVIRSTVPVGYTEKIKNKTNKDSIVFSPEFLREESALYDSLFPTRIIVGGDAAAGEKFAYLLKSCSKFPDTPILLSSATEAEAIKLFSNTFLAMRTAFFNELDSYAMSHDLDTKQIISGVCLDPRIGDYYNNPSFGYGGYCLPKDTKQLLSNYKGIPQNLVRAIVESNTTRKYFIADQVLALKPKKVGIYRLTMKKDADNFRSSAIHDVMERLESAGIELILYEPLLTAPPKHYPKIVNDIDLFKESCDVILANRITKELDDVVEKVFSRDIFTRD